MEPTLTEGVPMEPKLAESVPMDMSSIPVMREIPFGTPAPASAIRVESAVESKVNGSIELRLQLCDQVDPMELIRDRCTAHTQQALHLRTTPVATQPTMSINVYRQPTCVAA